MTLHASDHLHIPAETARVAHQAFPKGNVYLTMRDQLQLWYKDSAYISLFPSHQGALAYSPGLLTLIVVMQYCEGLTDRQAAEAVRSRIDWKYALGLSLTDSGFDASVLSRHRDRLLEQGLEQQLLDEMLSQFATQGLVKARGQQRTDSTHVLAAVRQLNRLECIGETLRAALNSLATVVPDWLTAQISPDWFDRYSHRFEQYRLPSEKAARQELGEQIGRDGHHLLTALYDEATPSWLRELPAVEILRQVWIQQFMHEGGQVKWRKAGNMPPAAIMIESPYDAEAHYSRKRAQQWVGYKVHLSESCDPELPHLITHVETTPATTQDSQMTATIHRRLAEKGLLPETHLVDAGYVDAAELVESEQQYQVELFGPVRPDNSWQARTEEAFDLPCFAIDWQAQSVTCPQGHPSKSWHPRTDPDAPQTIIVRFDPAICQGCPVLAQCTHSKNHARTLTLYPQAEHTALQQRRLEQHSEPFKERYRQRAGVEGTISQGVRSFELRKARYIGLAKTKLQHLLTAAALNLTRAVSWLQEHPRTVTRKTPFARLKPA